MDITQVIALLSGIALFLFGMSLMGDGLKKVSGDKLEPILYKLSGTPLRGLLLGTGVTAVIQSSSATAVMIVGFVSAGMMKVAQGISVILGAILGTSITGWVICLSYLDSGSGLAKLLSTATLTGVVAVIGILLRTVSKKKSTKSVGDILMGFVVLMVGMSTMSGAVSGLKDQPWFTDVLTSLSNPILGILVGALFTALLQSASAAVGIVQALSVTGAMQFEEAFPLLLGISVGAAVPVMLSALGTNAKGKRVSMVYPIATALGVVITALVFYIVNAVVHFPFMEKVMNPFSLAGANTIMRLFMILALFPLRGLIEKLVNVLIPLKPEDEDLPTVHLEEMLLKHPAMALEQCRITIEDMELGAYLVKLTGRDMTAEQNELVSKYLHTISDLELISDQALVIAIGSREAFEKFGQFSGNADHEMDVMADAVERVTDLAVKAFIDNDLTLAEQIEPLEEVVDNLCDTMKLNHVDRLQKKICTIAQGFIFSDIITGCERVSDHCANIAVAVIVSGHDSYDMHEYLSKLHEDRSSAYQHYFEKFREEYRIELAADEVAASTPIVRSASAVFAD